MEINRPKEKNIIVGVVYRPPNQKLQNFMNSLDLLLASISKGPCKRSQHCWPTRRNIVGPNMLRAFAHHVVCWRLVAT